MTEYTGRVASMGDMFDDASLLLAQLDYALNKERERSAELTKIVSGQELTISSLRAIVLGLGHQSMLDDVEGA